MLTLSAVRTAQRPANTARESLLTMREGEAVEKLCKNPYRATIRSIRIQHDMQ